MLPLTLYSGSVTTPKDCSLVWIDWVRGNDALGREALPRARRGGDRRATGQCQRARARRVGVGGTR